MIFFIFLFIAGSILRGYHALKFAVSNTRNLERPDLIVATNMRKMMACVTQVSYCAYHRKCYPCVIYFFICFPLTGTSNIKLFMIQLFIMFTDGWRWLKIRVFRWCPLTRQIWRPFWTTWVTRGTCTEITTDNIAVWLKDLMSASFFCFRIRTAWLNSESKG